MARWQWLAGRSQSARPFLRPGAQRPHTTVNLQLGAIVFATVSRLDRVNATKAELCPGGLSETSWNAQNLHQRRFERTPAATRGRGVT